MKTKTLMLSVLLSMAILVSCKNDSKSAENNDINTDETVDQTTDNSSIEAASGTFKINNNESVVYWVGSKPAGTHNGQIKVKNGEMTLENGKLTAAKFIADMTSINVMDLEGDEKKDLENHLKGHIEGKEDHFFNVDQFPESQFVLKKVTPNDDRFKVYGELTIRDQTHPVEFNSKLDVGSDKTSVKLMSEEFEIDRTKWGIEYMSKSVFDDLKERFIDDGILLKVELKASKTS